MNKFQRHLKLYKWWNAQVPFMCIAVYYQLICSNPTPNLAKAFLTMLLYLITTIGIAGYGHIMNDLFDREQDARTGSHNLTLGKSIVQIVLLFAVVLVIACLPWMWLPSSPLIFALVGLEFLLLTFYPVPPVRLKNRGVLGAIADASYAYTIPILVSTLVFGRLGGVAVPSGILWLIFAWSFCEGLCGILNHQLQDEKRDRADNIETFVTRFGWDYTFKLISNVLVPIEIVLFVLVLIVVGSIAPIVPVGYILYLAWMFHRTRNFGIWQTADIRRIPALDRLFFIGSTLLLRFYVEWLPVLLLVTLAWRAPIYIVWLLLHLWLFQNGITTLWKWDLPEMRRMRRFV